MSEPQRVRDLEELDVGEDPGLGPSEKQVSLTTTKKEAEFRVHSEVTSVSEWLIDHPAVEIDDYRVVEGTIVAVTGRLPRALVNLKAEPRNTNQFGRMLSSATLRDHGD